MSKEISIIDENKQDISSQLLGFESILLEEFRKLGLPFENVFVPIKERDIVIRNINTVLEKYNKELLNSSFYISKFLAATLSGLFDAALNYLWDETIYELRKRVAQYDLSYFYDLAVDNPDKRKKLNSEEDLLRIDDSILIKGALEIGLLSELGYRHIDNVRYMRNWASAAHPNQNQITGLQLISMLETCVIEVINLPPSYVVVQIKQLLGNIKNTKITQEDANLIIPFFSKLTQDQANALASGFFGIFTEVDTTSQTRQNIKYLIPHLWGLVDENTRYDFGIKYARFVAVNNKDKQTLGKEFLDVVSGASYMPEDIRVGEISTAIDNLLRAHRGGNNFYNEPDFAKELQRLIGQDGVVPRSINHQYVLCLVEVFLTNGNGTAWYAQDTYLEMLSQFDSTQASIAVFSFVTPTISSSLQFKLCREKFRELVNMMRDKISIPVVKELIKDIDGFTGPMEAMRDDSRIKSKISVIWRIVNPNYLGKSIGGK